MIPTPTIGNKGNKVISHAPLRFLRFLLFLILLPAPATAQTSDAARLEQLEETYRSNLRKYHAPVIQEYLAALEKLKESTADRGPGDGPSPIDSEIERIKKIGATTGIFPYDFSRPPPADKKADAPPPSKPVKKGAGAGTIILAASAATKSSPQPASAGEHPEGKAVPVGAAEWRAERIPAGEYRLSILYSCAGAPADAVITASIGAKAIPQVLTAANATGGVNEFRIVKLGAITLEREALGETVTLQNADPAKVAIWVRQVILARATEEKN